MLKQYKLRFYNFRLILWLLALSTIGVLLVGSARESLQNRQLFGVLSANFRQATGQDLHASVETRLRDHLI